MIDRSNSRYDDNGAKRDRESLGQICIFYRSGLGDDKFR